MAEADGEHWLWRLSAAQWLAAAQHELDQGKAQAGNRRAAIVYARRGAGMALNAVLAALGESADEATRTELEVRWGRSYVEHLHAVVEGDEATRAPLSEAAAAAARTVLATPLQARVVTLGRGPAADVHATLEAAQQLVDACAAAVAQSSPTH